MSSVEELARRALEVAAETKGEVSVTSAHVDKLHGSLRQEIADVRDRLVGQDVGIKQLYRSIYGDPMTANSPHIARELDNLTLRHAALSKDLSRLEMSIAEANNLLTAELQRLQDDHDELKASLKIVLWTTAFVSLFLDKFSVWLKPAVLRWAIWKALPIGAFISFVIEWLRAIGLLP